MEKLSTEVISTETKHPLDIFLKDEDEIDLLRKTMELETEPSDDDSSAVFIPLITVVLPKKTIKNLYKITDVFASHGISVNIYHSYKRSWYQGLDSIQ